MIIRTIKGVENDKWIKLKMLAAKKNVALGRLIEIMIEDYSRRADAVWNKALSGDKIINDSEARGLANEISNLRKEGGFRV